MVGSGAQRPLSVAPRGDGPALLLAHTEGAAKAFGVRTEVVQGLSPHGGMDVQEQWMFYQWVVRMSLETIAGSGFRSIYLCSRHPRLEHWSRPVVIAFPRATLMAGRTVTTDWRGEGDAAGFKADHGGK